KYGKSVLLGACLKGSFVVPPQDDTIAEDDIARVLVILTIGRICLFKGWCVFVTDPSLRSG
ncbi:MAG TPA: hypothetical protein PKH58_13895, partial [Paludibacteraceae bacterium]|nr:hypothetical protein [Paludibacteraceae bacterium]